MPSWRQIHGGYGYVNECVERFWRDVKLCEIGEGTSEIQRELIFNEVCKRIYKTMQQCPC
ncbi:MAG: acyl-CoA dehydrogenase family protein [Bdellovibrionota bacterium]